MAQEQFVYWDETEGKYKTLKPGEQPPPGVVGTTVRANPILSGPVQPGRGQEPPDLAGVKGIGEAITPKDLVTGGLRAAGTALPFLFPQAGAAGMGLRAAAGALPHTAAAALEGGDPLAEATLQTGMGVGGETLGRAIPYMGNAVALASANMMQRGKGLGFGRVTKAFTDDAERRAFPVLVGRAEPIKRIPGAERVVPSSKTIRAKEGERLAAAETASPVKTPLEDLGGASQGYSDRAVNTEDPLGLRKMISSADTTLIEGQALARHGWDEKQLTATSLQLAKALGTTPQAARQSLIKLLIEDTELTARELGELQRGISAQARPVFNRRNAGEPLMTGEAEKAQITENLMKRLRDIRHGPVDVGTPQTPLQRFRGADPKPGQAGAIRAADKRSSDAITMDQANKALRAGGVVGDLSLYGIRGALGATAGGIIGVNPLYASLVAMGLLHPQAISAGGHLLGSAAKQAPHAVRASQTVESTTGARRRRAEEKKDKR